jgi:hypothetical protein
MFKGQLLLLVLHFTVTLAPSTEAADRFKVPWLAGRSGRRTRYDKSW